MPPHWRTAAIAHKRNWVGANWDAIPSDGHWVIPAYLLFGQTANVDGKKRDAVQFSGQCCSRNFSCLSSSLDWSNLWLLQIESHQIFAPDDPAQIDLSHFSDTAFPEFPVVPVAAKNASQQES